MGLAVHAQSRPEDIRRFLEAKQRQLEITPADLQALAALYLDPATAVRVRVVPESTPGASEPQ